MGAANGHVTVAIETVTGDQLQPRPLPRSKQTLVPTSSRCSTAAAALHGCMPGLSNEVNILIGKLGKPTPSTSFCKGQRHVACDPLHGRAQRLTYRTTTPAGGRRQASPRPGTSSLRRRQAEDDRQVDLTDRWPRLRRLADNVNPVLWGYAQRGERRRQDGPSTPRRPATHSMAQGAVKAAVVHPEWLDPDNNQPITPTASARR